MLLGIEVPFNSKRRFDLISGSLCCFPLANISLGPDYRGVRRT